jgi:beta-mannosidase
MRNLLQKIFLFLFINLRLLAQVNEIQLDSNWQFRQINQTQYYPAKVPGHVIKDLCANHLIPDPFFADNESKLQWIEKENWEYQTKFNCNNVFLNYSNIDLIFEGLDTYSKVYLNDTLILVSNNMFRVWQVDVKKILHKGENQLKIIFESAVLKGIEESKKLNYTLPESERVFARKAQFHYGWDFAPRFAACGIWKPIKLSAWNFAKILDTRYHIKKLNDSLAEVDIIIESKSDMTKSIDFQLSYTNSDTYGTNLIKKNKKVMLFNGFNTDTISIAIKNPKRWWCNGLGEAHLYYMKLKLVDERLKLDERILPLGLRTIELINKKDSFGTSFYFALNGLPVFIKGANYVPPEIFLSSEYQYAKEIETYKIMHVNMLRDWGGGVYGDDAFYKACDKNGILVWQDFMFAGAMYPGDSSFIENVSAEVHQQIKRLRNHPSLALWCGNNEIDEAWNNWGWCKQYQYTKQDSTKIWKDYQNLFHKVIPQIKNELDAYTPYRTSSPAIGWGRAESLKEGDAHYWGVWWGMQPFYIFNNKVGRFMSEYGFQSMPSYETFQKIAHDSDLTIQSKAIKAHQKHKTGFETIQTYMASAYSSPTNFRDYIYKSQLLQRDGMRIAIEAHRRNKPRCMGTLFWQINDCWPAISWSAKDYFGQPKAFFYALKALYKSHLISTTQSQDYIEVTSITDSLNDFKANIVVKLLNFQSKTIWQQSFPVNLIHSKSVSQIIFKKSLPNFDTTQVYLKTELIVNQQILSDSYFFFTEPKYLVLPKSKISIIPIDSDKFEISSNEFIKDLFLYEASSVLQLDDNYFNLEAGQKKIVKVLKRQEDLKPLELKFLSLNQ